MESGIAFGSFHDEALAMAAAHSEDRVAAEDTQMLKVDEDISNDANRLLINQVDLFAAALDHFLALRDKTEDIVAQVGRASHHAATLTVLLEAIFAAALAANVAEVPQAISTSVAVLVFQVKSAVDLSGN